MTPARIAACQSSRSAMMMPSAHVSYADIPMSARKLLDELFIEPEAAEAWWNTSNRILGNYFVGESYRPDLIPRDYPEAAAALADAIADGCFF